MRILNTLTGIAEEEIQISWSALPPTKIDIKYNNTIMNTSRPSPPALTAVLLLLSFFRILQPTLM